MISIRVFHAHPDRSFRSREAVRIARNVLKGEGVESADLNVVFTGDKEMLKLNGKYLKHRRQTDVISFSLGAGEEVPRVEGEVYVNLDQAKRQKKAYRVTLTNEVSRLVVHGVLHLSGYEDRTRGERKKMTEMENYYLSKLRRE